MNTALILAGGIGTRLGGNLPKQYIEVCGKPIIGYCLDAFERNRDVDAIRIVAEKSWHAFILKWTGAKFRGFSMPGRSRQLSVFHALEDIRPESADDDLVIVHDAARPLVTERLISECIKNCAGHDGVMPALPLKDTVYASKDGCRVSGLLDSDGIYAGQSPEVFRLGIYYEANRRLLPERILRINGSAEPAVLAGMDIALIPGDENNFKITTGADLEGFRRMCSCRKEGTV